ncbi:MAG: class I SAM-dependent methyltransferase [Sphingomonas sp.]
MNEPSPHIMSVHDRVVANYLETTSSRSGTDPTEIIASTEGVARMLGDWAPQAGEVVVDLGSGKGEGCALALRRGAVSATGVNLSTGENILARQIVPGATFVDSDLVSWLSAAESNSVDRIMALNILEHLDKDTLAAVLTESARVLRPTGCLVAVTPNATSAYGSMTRYWDITHHIAFTPSSVRQIGILCGFRQFAFRECGPRPHGVISAIRYMLWQMIRLGIKARLMIEVASTKGGVYTADMMMRLAK